jgi:uncharacterized protein (TIGR02569 family)
MSGGQKTVWRVGSAVFKPLDSAPEVVAWQRQVLLGLDGREDFRVAPPLTAMNGDLAVDGWTAWRYESGRHLRGRWADIIGVSRAFHTAVETVARPRFLDRRDDRWAIGDRVAWGEVSAREYDDVDHVAELAAALKPIDAVPQLIHGDLTGNVLFAEGLPPLVIDLSPYWRPVATAAAIVIADALAFEGADITILDHTIDMPDFDQYLLRALIYRVVTDGLARRTPPNPPDSSDPYLPAVELALRLATL